MPVANEVPAVVLASGSQTRARMLSAAGVSFKADAPHVDESLLKDAMKAEAASGLDTAMALAELKATRKSPDYQHALVIGADQILECDGVWFDKPVNFAAARRTLEALAGRAHNLYTAAVVVLDGAAIWRHGERAILTMRELSPEFIDVYLARAGEAVLSSVGAYQVEGLGAQLFSRVEGDYFSILGLPLLPVLDFLRVRGVIET
ncbi:MAG: Maf family protein [Proteobacteria bacterium]|nr:Maf family protein [Pseudomonadota bacterium]